VSFLLLTAGIVMTSNVHADLPGARQKPAAGITGERQ